MIQHQVFFGAKCQVRGRFIGPGRNVGAPEQVPHAKRI
jgi:hypothetical protein